MNHHLIFIQGDIAQTGLRDGIVAYTSCDQVIMHTEDPEATFSELARITARDQGEFACYFYAKKALPRELVDDYFRTQCTKMERPDLWAMSEQLTELGKRLSALNVSFDCPDIPALGIKGGTYDIQRFIYWNVALAGWHLQCKYVAAESSLAEQGDRYAVCCCRFPDGSAERVQRASGALHCRHLPADTNVVFEHCHWSTNSRIYAEGQFGSFD